MLDMYLVCQLTTFLFNVVVELMNAMFEADCALPHFQQLICRADKVLCPIKEFRAINRP